MAIDTGKTDAVADEAAPPAAGAPASSAEADWIKATDVRPLVIGSWRWYIRRTLWVLYYIVCWTVFKLLYRWRVFNRQAVPRSGPVVLVCNHQSMLDPISLGLTMPRREFYAIARRTLMKNALARWVLLSINSIPIDRGESDRRALQDAIGVLATGRAMIVFPEGTRSDDGSVKPFKPGMLLIVRKSKAPVLPVAIAGAHEIWPPGRKWPKLTGRIRVKFGEVIPPEALSKDRDEALRQMQREVARLHHELETEH